MTTWAVALQARELFSGLRLKFTNPQGPTADASVTDGDELLFQREGLEGFEGRVLRVGSRGAVIETRDLSRWLISAASYVEKRRLSVAERTGNYWIVRERLP